MEKRAPKIFFGKYQDVRQAGGYFVAYSKQRLRGFEVSLFLA
jgi:hypothetical protein